MPERVAKELAQFLRNGFPSVYCVDCLAATLQFDVSKIRQAVVVLSGSGGFLMARGKCRQCHRRDDLVSLR